MNEIQKQILKNQISIISALETLLIYTGKDISNSYELLSKNFIETIVLIDEEVKDEQTTNKKTNDKQIMQ